MALPSTLIFLRPLLMTPRFLGLALGNSDRFFFFCLILPIVPVKQVSRWCFQVYENELKKNQRISYRRFLRNFWCLHRVLACLHSDQHSDSRISDNEGRFVQPHSFFWSNCCYFSCYNRHGVEVRSCNAQVWSGAGWCCRCFLCPRGRQRCRGAVRGRDRGSIAGKHSRFRVTHAV